MDPLQATIEEFAAEDFTHIECFCPRCRMTRLRPISWLPEFRWDLPLRSYRRSALCGVRRSITLGQAVAIGRPDRQAVGAQGITKGDTA